MIDASYDEETGITCSIAIGLTTAEEFNAYVPRCADYMARSRVRHGRSLHLVDARDNPIQSRGVFDHMTEVSREVLRAEDRCAIVINSALARMQIARMPDSFACRFFTDRGEATAWLLAEASAPVEQRVA